MTQGKLQVTVLKAYRLKDTAFASKQDVYIRVACGEDEKRSQVHQEAGTDPALGDTFALVVRSLDDRVQIQAWARHNVTGDELIGMCVLSPQQLAGGSVLRVQLHPKPGSAEVTGELEVLGSFSPDVAATTEPPPVPSAPPPPGTWGATSAVQPAAPGGSLPAASPGAGYPATSPGYPAPAATSSGCTHPAVPASYPPAAGQPSYPPAAGQLSYPPTSTPSGYPPASITMASYPPTSASGAYPTSAPAGAGGGLYPPPVVYSQQMPLPSGYAPGYGQQPPSAAGYAPPGYVPQTPPAAGYAPGYAPQAPGGYPQAGAPGAYPPTSYAGAAQPMVYQQPGMQVVQPPPHSGRMGFGATAAAAGLGAVGGFLVADAISDIMHPHHGFGGGAWGGGDMVIVNDNGFGGDTVVVDGGGFGGDTVVVEGGWGGDTIVVDDGGW